MLPQGPGFNHLKPPVFLAGEVRSRVKILTASQMGTVDRLTTRDCGLPSLLLMENAGLNLYQILKFHFGERLAGRSAVILCGKGNNGGDGLVLARQQDWAGSIGVLLEAVRIEPDSAAYGVRLAQAYAGAGMTAEAARTLGLILETHPANGKARLEMARIEESRGRLGAADSLLRHLLRAPAEGIDPEEVRFQLAVVLLRRERPAEAGPLLEEVVASDPDFPRAAGLLRAIQRRRKEGTEP